MNGIELLCFLAASAVAVMALLYQRRRVRLARPVCGAALVAGLAAAATFPGAYEPIPAGAIPAQSRQRGYVSSKTCRSCHPSEHRSWHGTYHRTMTQVVVPETVLADFEGSQFEYRGRMFHFQRHDDTFWVVTTNLSTDAVESRRRVVMSTGSHHYQIYWAQGEDYTEPLEVPIYWSIALARWVPKPLTVLQPPDSPDTMGHWNSHCIKCHSTGGVPGYDPQYEVLSSEVGEFGISCEACHGPGEEHVRRYQNPWNRYRRRLNSEPDTTIVNPARCSKVASTLVCGRCHIDGKEHDRLEFLTQGFPFLPGDGDLATSFELTDFDNPSPGKEEHVASLFWADGTCRTGGDELNAHLRSPCFQRGELTCLSCHSMHESDPDDQLAAGMRGNQACLQCHKEYATDVSTHTHHAADSPGSLCYNCHMPHTSYALSTAMRSHRIGSPNVAVSAQHGRPNACNLCHVDRSLDWAAKHLTSWYDTPTVALNDEQRRVSAVLLWMLKGDALQRAIAAWHLGWEPAREASGDRWQARFLAQLLQDPYAQVRLIASGSLRRMPGFDNFEYDFLSDRRLQREAAGRAVDHWRPLSSVTDERRDALLLDEHGRVDPELLKRLLDERDDSPISIPE